MFVIGDDLIANLLRRAADRVAVGIRRRERLAVDIPIPVIPGNGKALIRGRNLRMSHMRIDRGIDPELGTIRGSVCIVTLTKDAIRGAAINARRG